MTDFGFATTGEEVCKTLTSQIQGRTILITGTSANGLGAQCATTLAAHSPANLILVSRTKSKVDPVIAEIQTINPAVAVTFVPCELSDQDAVRHAAATILANASLPKIDVVINNAGVMAIAAHTLDKHGNELTLSSNHLGHFLLTNLLLPKLLSGARIVNLSSHGHRISPFLFDDPTFSRDNGESYNAWTAYGQSKTANVLFGVELARRLEGRGVRAFAVDPGFIMGTGLGLHIDFMAQLPELLAVAEKNNPGMFGLDASDAKSVAQGCSSTLVAALDPALEVHSGAFIRDCRVWDAMPYAVDSDNARKLWAYSEEAVGQKFDV